MSETLKAFRASLPDVEGMKIGERHFIPTLSFREDSVLLILCRKMNSTYSDRRWFVLPEWRSHVRGRLILVEHPDRAERWASLHRLMQQATRVNKRSPPLDVNGNALVPDL